MPATIKLKQQKRLRRVQLEMPGKTRIEFVFPKGRSGGMTGVSVNGVALRDANCPMSPAISLENGLVFDSWELLDIVREEHEITLILTSSARVDYYQEKGDAYNQTICTEQLEQPVTGTLRWYIKPHAVTIRGEAFTGFSYRFDFETSTEVAHHLLDRQTWEIDGAATGNTTINRGGFIRPEHTATLDSRHSTSEEFKQVGKRYFTFMQLRPRFGYVQCFDYQTGPSGSLLMYFEDVTAIRSLLHKEHGRDRFQYFDDHWQKAGHKLSTTWRYVVFHAASEPQDLWRGRNRWLNCWDYCANHYRSKVGLTEALPEYGISLGYWTRDMSLYRRYLDVFPKLFSRISEIGFTCWFMPLMNDNNMTAGIDVVPNMITSHNPCCPRDFVTIPALGGDEKLKEVIQQAKSHGLRSMHWIAGHMATESPDAPLFEKHPEWRTLGSNGLIYCPVTRVATPADLNAGYEEHFGRNLAHWARDLGMGAFFADSYPNFLMLVVNYANERLEPQQDAVLRVQKLCHDLGAQWYVEGESPFGISSNGLAGPILGIGSGEVENVRNLHRDNWTLDNFTGERQYVLYKTALATDIMDALDGKLPPELLFRIMAFKAPFRLGLEFKTLGENVYIESRPERLMPAAEVPECLIDVLERFPADIAEIIQCYNRVNIHMAHASILPDYAGSLWESEDGLTRIVFGFTPTRVALLPGEAAAVEMGKMPVVIEGGKLKVEPRQVYLLSRKN